MDNKEKNGFMLGLTMGIAIISLIGFVVMSVAYFSKDSSDFNDNNDKVVANNKQPTNPTPTPTPPADTGTMNVKVSDKDWFRGDKDAPVTIVEFSDIQCPFCSRFHNTLRQVMDAYPGKVKWVFKHFPLDSLHPYARKAAEASECAGEQGKFWEYIDTMYDNQSKINNEYISEAAKNIGLNTKKFESCLEGGKYTAKVNSDFQQGQAAGVRGTPGGAINGKTIKGALPFEQIKAMIDAELN